MILNRDLEFEIMVQLIKEIILVEDQDNNGSLFMREFTFFEYSCNHILNVFRYNMEDFSDDAYRIDKYTISFFDFADWYYQSKYNTKLSNNPCNETRYYCSRYTGPGWYLARETAKEAIGTKKSAIVGPSLCCVEKISDSILKYTEIHNDRIVPINFGAGAIYWRFTYEPFIQV